MSSATKRVSWKYEVTEYEALRTRDSQTTTPPPFVEQATSLWSPHRSTGSASSSSSFASTSSFSSFGSSSTSSSFQLPSPAFQTLELNPLPPTPIIPTIPLPDSAVPTPQSYSPNTSRQPSPTSRNPSPSQMQIDKSLQMGNPSLLIVDFSFPSWHYQQSREMAYAFEAGILDRPAVDPTCKALDVTFMLYEGAKAVIPVRADPRDTNEKRDFVTVGALLMAIHQYFRQHLPANSVNDSMLSTIQSFFNRRVNTVNGSSRVSQNQYRVNIDKERRGGYRVVDMMLGKTRFAGLTIVNNDVKHCELALHLEVPERYER